MQIEWKNECKTTGTPPPHIRSPMTGAGEGGFDATAVLRTYVGTGAVCMYGCMYVCVCMYACMHVCV